MAEALGTGNVDHRIRQLDFADAAVAEPFQMPAADIEKAAVVLLVGCNIRHEMPLLHQRLLKASKRGARIFAINPVDFEFAFKLAGKRIVAPSKLPGALRPLRRRQARIAVQLDVDGDEISNLVAEAIKAAGGNAVIVLGELAESHAAASHLHARRARAGAGHRRRDSTASRRAPTPSAWPRSACCRRGRASTPAAMLAEPLSTYLLFGIEPQYDFAQAAAGCQVACRRQGRGLRCIRVRRVEESRRRHPADRPAARDRSHADQSRRHRADQRRRRQVAGRGALGLARPARADRDSGTARLRLHRHRRIAGEGQAGRHDFRRRHWRQGRRRRPGWSESPPRRSIGPMPCCVARRRSMRIRLRSAPAPSCTPRTRKSHGLVEGAIAKISDGTGTAAIAGGDFAARARAGRSGSNPAMKPPRRCRPAPLWS